MTERPLLIVSDTHLGAVPEATERAFRRFLEQEASRASGLLINGDLFDFWFEYRTVIPRKHFRVLGALAALVEGGIPVWYVGGNHDGWGGEFLRDDVGITLLEGPVTLELAGRKTLIAHGDGVGAGDLGYRVLKSVIRNGAVVRAFRLLHPDLGTWIATRVSTTEDKADHSDTSGIGRALPIRSWAREQLLQDPSIDLVVAGHSHLPEIEEVAPGRFYANSGDWVRHSSYLELSSAERAPLLRSWPTG